MKIILEDFDYKGMHFDKYEADLPISGDIYFDALEMKIVSLIKEKLDQKVWDEISVRG